METLLGFVKILGLIALCFISLAIIFGIVEGTINYFKEKKTKKEFSENMKGLFDELLDEITKEMEEETKKKTTKKATRKPRKPKEKKEEDK